MTARKAVIGVLVGLLLAAFGVALSAPASAAPTRNGKCESGEFCYYYHSKEYGYGSVSDFQASHASYFTASGECYHFLGAGDGKGECVKNKAAAVQNLTGKTVRVYYNTGYAGTYQDVKPGFKGNLISALWHNNASHKILSSTGTAQTPVNDYDGNPRGFAQWNCTAFAAFRVATRDGHSAFKEGWDGVIWGNAGTWDDAARKIGLTVNKTPSVGAIAVNDVHKVGHVAYVNKVYSDGSFDVEEYNWNYPYKYGTRSHITISSAQAAFQWMIHF